MAKSVKLSEVAAVGMAVFSMYFGAGNVTFPIAVGQTAQDMSAFAIVGLLATAVFIPFFGLFAMSFYEGDYFKFFGRLGKIPAWFFVATIMLLAGPFAALPRCIVISYSTLQTLIPGLNLTFFSAVSCLLIFAFTVKPNQIMNVLGKFLTPVLLLSLLIIIVKGLLEPTELMVHPMGASEALAFGFVQGYNTMDLFASFIFSGVVLKGISELFAGYAVPKQRVVRTSMAASLIAMGLLAFVYTGMCYVAAHHGQDMSHVNPEKMLSALAVKILGNSAGIVVCIAVTFACLTTAIALSVVSAQFINRDLSGNRIPYIFALLATLGISFAISTLEFAGIQGFLFPILQATLPGLILLCVLNFLYATTGFAWVKTPVFLTFALTTYWVFYS